MISFMKLKFDSNQQYQLDAIQAVVDIFTGQPKDGDSANRHMDQGRQLSLEATIAKGNSLTLDVAQIIENTHKIQEKNDIEKSEAEEGGFNLPITSPLEISEKSLKHGMNFSIEMETGTGKTYVYLRTIHELHQHYGWKKFIIVVPSVAIREGVLKNLAITREHFADLYNKPEMDYYVWDSKKTGQAREYTANGAQKGKFAKWFEEAYAKVASKPKYAGVMDGLSASEVHDGYFAADKSGQWKDSRDTKGEGGRTKDDDTAYNLIMKDKERLLDTGEPLRFIFSHSALREGWDNPNVFQICTLNETSSQMKKRQEIGRGLRLPVNVDGQRVYDDSVNILTVVANESYAEFSRKLQTEIEEETGIHFGGRIKNRDNRQVVSFQKSRALDPAFKELWDKIKHKTTYRVAIDTEKLAAESANELAQITISKPHIADTKTLIDSMNNDSGFMMRETGFNAYAARQTEVKIPNLLADIQRQTQMTRRVIFEVLDQAGMFEQVVINPQQVIDETARAINRVKQRLAVDGVKYHRTGEYYDMTLFENDELQTYLYDAAMKSGAIAVGDQAKTIYDYVAVDSEVEREFMQSLEDNTDVKFYIKLPSWFKIDTPVGKYNPDWVVAFDGDERIYFVAETKGSEDINDNHLSANERGKITAARQHFAEINVPYAAPVRSLRQALTMVGDGNCGT